MNDTDLAVALDACLWITPSGEARDNAVNLQAVKDRLEEGEEAFGALKDLTDALLPSRLWQGQARVAQALLEALVVVREQSAP